MFKNYLKIAVRNLLRHKAYSLINILGLAVGMACCILIMLYVQDELSYDRYHEKADRIYRVVEEGQVAGKTSNAVVTPAPMGPALVNDYPEVINVVRFFSMMDEKLLITHEDRRFQEERFLYADGSAFEVFTFPLLKGNPRTALKAPYTVVLTEEMAAKYFGGEDPLDQTLTIDGKDYKVTGVLENIPSNSHFHFDFLASFTTLKEEDTQGHQLGSWMNHSFYTYLLLAERASPTELEQQLPAFMNRHMGEQLRRAGVSFTPHLQPLTRIHLHSHLEYELEPNSDIRYTYIFSAIAFFILLIACINFVNLSTARSAHRAKEAGMRKVIGAHRLQLIKQFLGESALLSFISLLLAMAFVELVLPAFNSLSGKELTLAYDDQMVVLAGLVGIALLVGVISGTYPAFFLSAFQPAAVLKGTLSIGMRGARFRKLLVIAQFAISILLIVATGVVQNQLDYIRTRRLGFDKEQVVVVSLLEEAKQKYEVIKSELSQIPGVLRATAAQSVPGGFTPQWLIRAAESDAENIPMYMLFVDHDFIETLGIELAEGRNFSREYATDATRAFILNQAAVKKLGWNSTAGKELEWLWLGDQTHVLKKGPVVGVVKDFHFRSLHHEIEPVVIHIAPGYFSCIAVRIRPGDVAGTLNDIEAKWRKLFPDHPLEYSFLDEDIAALYPSENKLGRIVGYFSLLAIFIACLGLLGLASFATEQRTKEIGIRKVLGASVSSIVLLLSKEFTGLVILANLIAWPVAYFAMKDWLEDFAYRIDVGIGTFVLGGVLALVIALLTVSSQAIKAALANPVDALRYE